MSEVRDGYVSFRAPREMIEQLDKLGAATDNSRSNLVFLILAAALNGVDPADQLKVMQARE